ncbi:MAG: EAL domain-containing protein [Rhodospirillales bacterium]|nr:EAL domain-containing protein [Rhodospirillales bacterium]
MTPGEIDAALCHARIEARFQPIVRIADRAPVALEALARIDDPVHGVIAAERFVPQIERAGRADDLTDQVVASIFADLARGLPAMEGLRVGINLPLDLLLRPDTLARLEAAREAAGIAAALIVIELTENQQVEDAAALGRALEAYRRAGFGAAIDDVGPAMRWVDRLLDLPFTGLKLDGAIVALAGEEPAIGDFAAGIVAAARRRDMRVTAEGVEDAPAWRQAVALGADQAQGFLIGPVLRAEALAPWRARWGATPAVHSCVAT